MFSAKAALFPILVCLSVVLISSHLKVKALVLPSLSSFSTHLLCVHPVPNVMLDTELSLTLSVLCSISKQFLFILPFSVCLVIHLSAYPSCPPSLPSSSLLPLLFIYAAPALILVSAHCLSSLLLPPDLGHGSSFLDALHLQVPPVTATLTIPKSMLLIV